MFKKDFLLKTMIYLPFIGLIFLAPGQLMNISILEFIGWLLMGLWTSVFFSIFVILGKPWQTIKEVIKEEYKASGDKAYINGVHDAIEYIANGVSSHFVEIISIIRELPDENRNELESQVEKLHQVIFQAEKFYSDLTKQAYK